MEVDFHSLYSELRVQPDCSLDDFKRAYRRRVAELHPDRHGDQAVRPDTPGMSLPAKDSGRSMAPVAVRILPARMRHNRCLGRPSPGV